MDITDFKSDTNKPSFDVDKFLDSLTIEELRAFAKIGLCNTLSFCTKAISSLLKAVRSDSK